VKEYVEIFCSNDDNEIAQIKFAFERNKIKYNFSIKNTDNVIFGISPLSTTRDLSYKYQIQVIESELDDAERIIKELLSINNESENETTATTIEIERDTKHYIENNEIPNIGRSILLLLVFCHFSRFFHFVSKNIKNKMNRYILYILGIVIILCTIFLPSINYIQWYGSIFGLLGSILLFAIIQLFINLVDFIITRNTVQGYTGLILLGTNVLLIIGMIVLPRSS